MAEQGASRAQPIDRLLTPLRIFARHKLAGAGLLMVATAAALIWANSTWQATYTRLLATHLTVGFGALALSKPLLLWINDGVMGIFFFVVGLEIKREILAGELSSVRKATLPIVAAVGGMVVPALVFYAVNPGGPAARGWGIPMATDIAFALGVMALLGDRVPGGLKVLLTALAIVDDIGAILVIALFYTDNIALVSLAAGGVCFALAVAANLAGVRHTLAYLALGTLCWLGFLKSGVHATLAAVLMALTIPSRSRLDLDELRARLARYTDTLAELGGGKGSHQLAVEEQRLLHHLADDVEKASAPLQDLEHAMAPLVTFFVLPLFALANAGVAVQGDLWSALVSPLSLGIVAGLFVGKQAGIVGAAWLAVKAGLADLPREVSWSQVHAVGALGGVGFTMALFVNGLAFPGDAALQDTGKVGVIAASLASGIVGLVLLALGTRRRTP